MKFSLSGLVAWARQATTGLGASTVVTALAGGATHTISWPEAALGIGAGVLMMAHPELSKEKATTIVATLAPVATTGIKDVAQQIASKHIDAVTDVKDLLALANALDAALPLVTAAPVPAPQAAPVAAAAAA